MIFFERAPPFSSKRTVSPRIRRPRSSRSSVARPGISMPRTLVLRIRPVLVGHLRAVLAHPHHVLLAAAVEHPAEERAPPQHRVRPEDLQGLPREREHVEVAVLPVEPAELVVLAVGVVVAPLRPSDLVAAEEHPHPLREDERGHQVALHPLADLDDLRLVGRALDAPVVREVLVGAVLVVLAVRLVVLLRVHDQVLQREAVVRGHEVDRGVGVAAARLVQVAGAGEPEGELRELARDRLARTVERSPGTCRSIRPSRPGSCPPGSRRARRPRARRSASPARAPGPAG